MRNGWTLRSWKDNKPNDRSMPGKPVPRVWLTLMLVFFVFIARGVNRERLVFDLKLGFVKGGEAILVIKDTVYGGKKAIDYHLKGRTTGVTDKIFKVDDVYESTVDAETHLPYRAVRNIKERKYRYYNSVEFFHDRDSIYSQKTGWMKVPPNLTDLLTVFFYFTRQNLLSEIDLGHTVVLPTLNGHEIQQIKIRFQGFEKIETPMGIVECYVLSPVMDKGKVLRRSDGLRFYISKETKIPIQLDFETKAGTLRAVLESYRINGKEQLK